MNVHQGISVSVHSNIGVFIVSQCPIRRGVGDWRVAILSYVVFPVNEKHH
jgi:hypothetical protein